MPMEERTSRRLAFARACLFGVTTLSQRTLLLLGCGLEQIEALRIARELGYRTIAFDNDPQAAGRDHADEFLRVDLRDPHALFGQAELASPDGVFVHAAELAVQAACIAEMLSLPGPGVEAARLATEKHLRIARLEQAGLVTPRFRTVPPGAPHAKWREAAEAVGFPCVWKPSDQAGARGVEAIPDGPALDRYADRARAAFPGASFVCESLHTGVELSTESVVADGKPLHHALALRHYDTTARYHPHFIEDGHSLPYAVDEAMRGRIEDVIERSALALGLENGVLKGDLLIQDDGTIVILEMAARTSGGRFADTVVPLGTGVNILYPLIEQAMGDAFSRDWFTQTRQRGVSQRFFLHDGERRVTKWPRLTELLHQPGVHLWHLHEPTFRSSHLRRITSHRERFGFVICTAETREEADAQALSITAAFADQLESEPWTETHR